MTVDVNGGGCGGDEAKKERRPIEIWGSPNGHKFIEIVLEEAPSRRREIPLQNAPIKME
jgi:hypothetical protein